jgi:hypothetical protein
MANRDFRLAEFNQGEPPAGQQLQALCEDHNGTSAGTPSENSVCRKAVPQENGQSQADSAVSTR